MPKISDISGHYERLAAVYEQRWQVYIECQIEWILRHWPLSMTENFTVLDLGCGTGLMLERIRQRWPEAVLIGVDASAGMLDKARQRLPSAQFMRGDVEDAGFVTQLPQADIVISMSILHHLNDTEGHLRLLRGLTKSGGTVFLSVFAKEGWIMDAADWWFRLTQPHYNKSWPYAALAAQIKAVFPAGIRASEVLRPDRFWRIQIFSIAGD